MHRFRIALSVVVLVVAWAELAVAQDGVRAGEMPQSGSRLYDPRSVETLSGEVVSMHSVASRQGEGAAGIHMMLQTEKETIAVHLGPTWYLRQYVSIATKDHVEVRGSRVTYHGHPAIIAAELRKGNQTVNLRDETGRPLWRGGTRP